MEPSPDPDVTGTIAGYSSDEVSHDGKATPFREI